MYYIIIRGPAGSGKSTISKQLAYKLKGHYVSVDKILEVHKMDKVKGKCIPEKNFIKANEIIIRENKEKIKRGQILVIDGNFYHKNQIKHIIDNLSYQHFVFTLKAPLNQCLSQDSKRKNNIGEQSIKAVHRLVSEFDLGTIIQTKGKTEKQIIEEILSHLPRSQTMPKNY